MWRLVFFLCVHLACITDLVWSDCFQAHNIHDDVLKHACDNRNHNYNLTACITFDWGCRVTDHFCWLRLRQGDVHFSCDNTQLHFDECVQRNSQNAPTCDPRVPPTDHNTECSYCCEDAQCFANLLASPQTMTTASPAVPHGENSCYTSACNPGDNFATCTSGQWACGQDQFCEFHVSPSGVVQMSCMPKTFDALQHCQQLVLQNNCYPAGGSYDHDCHYCCTDETCVTEVMTSMNGEAPVG